MDGLVNDCKQKALNWLLNSGIDRGREGCCSVYVPDKDSYYSWTGGDSCLLCTAGCVLVYLKYGYLNRAIDSALHIEGLMINSGKLNGAILSGKNSDVIRSFYISYSILAFLELYKATKNERYLQIAQRSAIWLLSSMQRKDGSIEDILCRHRHSFKAFLKKSYHTWEAVLVPILHELNGIKSQELFIHASDRLSQWLKTMMLGDGSFYCYSSPFLISLLNFFRFSESQELFHGCSLKHPLSQSASIEAFLLNGEIGLAKKTFNWLADKLSDNGLFYQFYFNSGNHSLEEDVMPTAHFGIVLNRNKRLFGREYLIEKIFKGITYAQAIDSQNNRVYGGIRGIPKHPTDSENLYAWDTQYSLLFLNEALDKGRQD